MSRLKVFRTTSGIHDHVVATTSRPAALKAWGARTDLFSMGVASEVTDPKIRKQALDNPGQVIRISRSGGIGTVSAVTRNSPKKRVERPSRRKLDAAEKRLQQLTAKQESQMAAIDQELGSLERKRRQLERLHAKARSAAEDRAEAARSEYEAALEDWNPAD